MKTIKKIKKVKGIIALCLMIGLAASLGGPGMVTAIDTSITPNYNGGSNPDSSIFVKGKWEMKGPCFTEDPTGVYTYNGCSGVSGGEGQDDSGVAGSQFDAPNIWGANMNYTVCAIVRGPNNHIDSIRDVYADIWYPTNRPMHTSGFSTCYNSGTSNDDPYEIDNPSTGCGVHIEQNNLHRLSQADGINLVCNEIRVNNTNLPVWDPAYVGVGGADWGELCAVGTADTEAGELRKGWAAVYCSDKSISWEHPAGDYRVTATAYDTGNNQSNVLTNYFTYQETPGFEIDFDGVDYGVVSISEHVMIPGDKCFWPGDSNVPTIRNTGNVRLDIKIAQDDMGLGRLEDDSDWRAEYDARVGDLYDDLTDYDPFGAKGATPSCGDYTSLLGEILDLSEIEEMDFSIHVKEKWPGNEDSYTGNMWLGANMANFGPPCGLD